MQSYKCVMRTSEAYSMKHSDKPDLAGRWYFNMEMIFNFMHADQQPEILSQHLIMFIISWKSVLLHGSSYMESGLLESSPFIVIWRSEEDGDGEIWKCFLALVPV